MKNIFVLFLCIAALSGIAQKRLDFGAGISIQDASVLNSDFKSTYGFSGHMFLDKYTGESGFFRFGVGVIDRGFTYKNNEGELNRVFGRNVNLIALKGWEIQAPEKCKPKVLFGPSYDIHDGNPWHISGNLQVYCSWPRFEVGADLQRSLNDIYQNDAQNYRWQNLGLRMNVLI